MHTFKNNGTMKFLITVKEQFVINIAGTAGSGKSTLAQEFEQAVGDATTLKLDDYFSFLSGWPEDIRKWLDEGANFQDWKNIRLVADIKSLLNGQNITYPLSHETRHPCKWIFVEDPSGREREEMKELVDFVFYIDIPNDIAYMRALNRWLNKEITREDGSKVKKRDSEPEKLINEIINYVKLYVNHYRDLYVTACEIVKKDVDLIIDGTKSTKEQVEQVKHFLKEKGILQTEETKK